MYLLSVIALALVGALSNAAPSELSSEAYVKKSTQELFSSCDPKKRKEWYQHYDEMALELSHRIKTMKNPSFIELGDDDPLREWAETVFPSALPEDYPVREFYITCVHDFMQMRKNGKRHFSTCMKSNYERKHPKSLDGFLNCINKD